MKFRLLLLEKTLRILAWQWKPRRREKNQRGRSCRRQFFRNRNPAFLVIRPRSIKERSLLAGAYK